MDLMMWLEHGGGMQLYQEMYDKYGYNVKVFVGAPLPGENFQWSKKPLKKLEDFKGVKMRMMPLMGDVLSQHGFSVVFMPGSEIMPNLQRGVIDAAEFSNPAFDKTLGIWEVCKYVMIPGVHQPCASTEILINKKSYAALPDDLKKKLEIAIKKVRWENALWVEKKNLEAMEFLKANGVTFVEMDPETVSTMAKWAWEYLDKRSEKDAFFGKVWNSQKAFMKKWYPYTKAYNPRFE
jgi:TRAP-type mannitol/chloroaromatic compound transport system substrate-binding protein